MSRPDADIEPILIVDALAGTGLAGIFGTPLDVRGYNCVDYYIEASLGAGTQIDFIPVVSRDGTATTEIAMPYYQLDTGAAPQQLHPRDLQAEFDVSGAKPVRYMLPGVPAIGQTQRAFIAMSGALTVSVWALRRVEAGPQGPYNPTV